jgi:hypothetical protein
MIMSKASLAQSSTAITRLQFLMLMMMENGATVTEALEEALRWGSRHPDSDLYDRRSHVDWARDESMVLEPLESDDIKGDRRD